MAKVKYLEKTFRKKSLDLIAKMDSIATDYHQRGYELSGRQLFYQMVARGFIENSEKTYKATLNTLNDARLAGLIDWALIVDRTRNLRGFSSWDSPADVISSAAYSFRLDLWEGQPCYCEVWIEKDALVSILQKACARTRTPFFSCRGYTSISELWAAAERFKRRPDKECIIIHLGDFDPSGLDMSRDIQERLNLLGASVRVERVALSMEQIEAYKPPPNPAKTTDTRFKEFRRKYGSKSWELDAMQPEIMEELIHQSISRYLDKTLFEKRQQEEEEQRQELLAISGNYQGALMGAKGA